ncbi:ion transport peptide isoform X2 [Eurytemora carolleeae]|nr:ion transport peptide isoform X2 [Eurytemora carolleeae]|eukprot:XP_023346951.1 ion transport peptide-like isoform X2 [Eurytemora affinis]
MVGNFYHIKILVLVLLLNSALGRIFTKPDRRSQAGFEDGMCTSPPSLQMAKFLDRICEDCYRLYRDIDVYQMCRSGCYGSEYFLNCMNSIMVSTSTKSKAVHFLNLINNFST